MERRDKNYEKEFVSSTLMSSKPLFWTDFSFSENHDFHPIGKMMGPDTYITVRLW